jgi:sigma-B regulation protein RsbU (phosphoserine phosphatase)
MNNRSQFSDTPSVPVLNWRTASGLDYASFSIRGQVPGGDYTDFVPMANGEFALMLGETDAKGQPADWTSACIRGAVRGFIARGQVNPMMLAHDLNRIIYDVCPIEQIVSFLYAHYNAKTGILTYVNAGHEAALLLQNGQRHTSLLDLGGPVLGLTANSTYTEGSVRLRPGDRIIAFTTGVIDALASGPIDSAEAELLEIARDCADTDSRDLAGAVLNRISYANAVDSSRDRSLVVVSKNDTVPSLNRSVAQRELAMAH